MKTKVMILGVTGMLGSMLLDVLSNDFKFITLGTIRSKNKINLLPKRLRKNIICGVNAEDLSELNNLLYEHKPEIVINCIGLIKQLSQSNDPLLAFPINTLLPHRLSQICSNIDARLIHISTDCVFKGDKGMYSEKDIPDATDIYGISKRFGELDIRNAITLRTSIIGHELNSSYGLIEWFLSQTESVNGYTNVIFSGLTTLELAHIIIDKIIPNRELSGLFNISSEAISKYDLLCLVAKIYKKNILINKDSTVKINRSLNSEKFKNITNYIFKSWPEMVSMMFKYEMKRRKINAQR